MARQLSPERKESFMNAALKLFAQNGILHTSTAAIAKEAGIYIHQDANLSNFLQKLEIGEEIPKELYLLIAELIAFVYMLDGKFPERWDNMHKRIMQEV